MENGKKNWRGRKKIGERSEPRGSQCGGKRVAEPGDMPLMPSIRPHGINLSLKCQHVSTSAYYVAFVKRDLNSR